MKVSIIIPSLNNHESLKDCITSIKKQSFDNYEVWVIDGNSKDGTKEYLESLQDPFFWVCKDDKGVYDAMNNGIRRVKGDWIYFIGSDDKLYNENILKDVFTNHFNVKTRLILGEIKYHSKKKDSYFIKKNNAVVKPSWSYKLWLKNTLPHQGVFYRREIFNNRNYNLKYKMLADYAFNLRLFKIKIGIKKVNNIIALCGTNGLSKNYNWNLYKEEIQLKVEQSNIILKPLFFLISIIKFLIKKMGV